MNFKASHIFCKFYPENDEKYVSVCFKQGLALFLHNYRQGVKSLVALFYSLAFLKMII